MRQSVFFVSCGLNVCLPKIFITLCNIKQLDKLEKCFYSEVFVSICLILLISNKVFQCAHLFLHHFYSRFLFLYQTRCQLPLRKRRLIALQVGLHRATLQTVGIWRKLWLPFVGARTQNNRVMKSFIR